MTFRQTAIAIGILTLVGNITYSQNIYWSDKDLGEGAIEGPLVVEAETGDSGVIFMYYSPNGQDITEGFDVDFSWQTPGIVAFQSAETFDFDITIVGQPLGLRWEDFSGPAMTLAPDSVEGFLAVNV